MRTQIRYRRLKDYDTEPTESKHKLNPVSNSRMLSYQSKNHPSFIDFEAISRLTEDVKFKNEIIAKLPINLHELLPIIEDSKYILELPDNWDEDGGIKYSEQVWKSAIKFLIDYAVTIFDKERKVIKMPKIYHGPNGGIDIYWENANFNFLFDINTNGIVTFYGDDYTSNKIQGEFLLDEIDFRFLPSLI